MGQESLEKGKELVELHSKPLQEGRSTAPTAPRTASCWRPAQRPMPRRVLKGKLATASAFSSFVSAE